MKFKLEIECNNAAFEDAPDDEIARILRSCARRLEIGFEGVSGRNALFDANGNRVGTFQLEETK